jgi:hypothetical protein
MKPITQVKSYSAAHREKAKIELRHLLSLNPNSPISNFDTETLAQALLARIKSLPLNFTDIFDIKRAIKVVNEVNSGGSSSSLGESSQKQKEARIRASVHLGNNAIAIATRLTNEARVLAISKQKTEAELDIVNEGELLLDEMDWLHDAGTSQHPIETHRYLIDLNRRIIGTQTILGGLKERPMKDTGVKISDLLEIEKVKMQGRAVAISEQQWSSIGVSNDNIFTESQQTLPADGSIGNKFTRGSKSKKGSILNKERARVVASPLR